MSQAKKKQYDYKIGRQNQGPRGQNLDVEVILRGSEEAWSKLSLRDDLSRNYPRTPLRLIAVWLHGTEEPEFPKPGKKFPSSPHEHFSFMSRPHNSGATHFRVWRRGWGGDQFEVLTSVEYRQLEEFLKRFGIPLKEFEIDED